jgi:hypothetical protein
MKAQVVIDRQHLILGDLDIGPIVKIQGVAVRNYRIQRVIAPGQL